MASLSILSLSRFLCLCMNRYRFLSQGVSISGKRKRGSQIMYPNARDGPAVLCTITLSDGSAPIVIPSPIKGSVVEINLALAENPSLIQTRGDTDGWIAVMLIKKKEQVPKMRLALLTEDAYAQSIGIESATLRSQYIS